MKIKKFANLEGHAERSGKVIYIAPHHMAGNLSLEQCYQALKAKGSSCTYMIDSNGNIGQALDEKFEPYTTSNREFDDKAITIEVANDGGAPDWHVSDKAIKSLIELLVDVCKRHKIAKLNYTGDKKGNLQKHSYYHATLCPGPYLGGKFDYIAKEVNKKLTAKPKYYFKAKIISNGWELTPIIDTYIFNDFEATSVYKRIRKNSLPLASIGKAKYNKKGYFMHMVYVDGKWRYVAYKKKQK